MLRALDHQSYFQGTVYLCKICQRGEEKENDLHFGEDKLHIVLQAYGENPVLYSVKAKNGVNGGGRNLHRNMLQPSDDLLDNFKWNLTKEIRKQQEQ